jgi:hypothetical protein
VQRHALCMPSRKWRKSQCEKVLKMNAKRQQLSDRSQLGVEVTPIEEGMEVESQDTEIFVEIPESRESQWLKVGFTYDKHHQVFICQHCKDGCIVQDPAGHFNRSHLGSKRGKHIFHSVSLLTFSKECQRNHFLSHALQACALWLA